MQRSFKNRLERLEAARRPPEPTWAIGVDWVVGWGTAQERVVAHTPPRLIEPGQPFDYQQVIDDITTAHAAMANIADDFGLDLIEDDDDQEP